VDETHHRSPLLRHHGTAEQELYIAGNAIQELPAGVGQLAALEILDLTFNQLTTLPDELGQCTRLTELEVAHNRLTSVPASLGGLVRLVEMDLSANELTTLPPELSRLTSLRHLKLCYCRLQRLPHELAALVPPPETRVKSGSNDDIPNDQRPASAAGKGGHLLWLSTEGNEELTDLPTPLASITEHEFREEDGVVRRASILNTSTQSLASSPSAGRERSWKERAECKQACPNGGSVREAHCVSWAEMRGMRPSMEDTIYLNHTLRPGTQLYAIFDGHRSSDAAEVAVCFSIPCLCSALFWSRRTNASGFICLFRSRQST